MAIAIVGLLFFSACSNVGNRAVDGLNEYSYAFHYKNLDSTEFYAQKAYGLSESYDKGKAEALNNLAFVAIARMDYEKANVLLDSIIDNTDNQIELLIAEVQYMRLCQRQSQNKNFYDYREQALDRLARIDDAVTDLNMHQQKRLIYAKTELAIVTSIYYYYIGLENQSRDAILAIKPDGEILKDTSQYLNYLYQIGSGGIISNKSESEIKQEELEYLLKCYQLSEKYGYTYWLANSMQSISEHIQTYEKSYGLLTNNRYALDIVNKDGMPDSLLAGNLAQNALELFVDYGDIYQIAGGFRTLASCYWQIKDYSSALTCLESSLENILIFQAPDLVASIREQLSIVYAAMNNKKESDYNRNIYLDLQDETRQDRELDARAEKLEEYSRVQNILIISIICIIVVVLIFIFTFIFLNKKRRKNDSFETLSRPLKEWKDRNVQYITDLNDDIEQMNEDKSLLLLRLNANKRYNIENKAKIFLVNTVSPLIDRIINEVSRLLRGDESDEIRSDRYSYVKELAGIINESNDVLTYWIQLRQGEINMHIESFPLSDLFKIVEKSRMSFLLKDIQLKIEPSDAIVKADKVLTLFMINTLADNARKFTPKGGIVSIYSNVSDEFVEICVEDSGCGIDEDKLRDIFNHKVKEGHGFGLMNCHGIIEKYKKTSSIFKVCEIKAESKVGEGSRFSFRLPKGVIRTLRLILVMICLLHLHVSYSTAGVSNREVITKAGDRTKRHNTTEQLINEASRHADSIYYCNVNALFDKSIQHADSAIVCLNAYYKIKYPNGKNVMSLRDDNFNEPAEISWFYDSVKIDYDIILDIRNEIAVAAMALHDWDLYDFNNNIYTRLFREISADSSLAEYCRIMKESEINKIIAIILLTLFFIVILVAYYIIYYRHVLHYRYCVEKITDINKILLGTDTDQNKLELINEFDSNRFPDNLREVVEQIKDTLRRSVDEIETKMNELDSLNDELKRIKYENDNIYICNNVMDNCLSTLKHETMYYPSKILALADDKDTKLNVMNDLLIYYKELYTILTAQTVSQMSNIRNTLSPISLKAGFNSDLKVSADPLMFDYLFEILRKFSGGDMSVSVSSDDNNYVRFDISMPNVSLTYEQCMHLFAPDISNIPLLICRQIVRENSEVTNKSGCGITAIPQIEGSGIIMRVVLSKGKD